jgi:hypothetical protein
LQAAVARDSVWRRRSGSLLAGAGLAAILLATLWPSDDAVSGVFEWCVPCGEFGLSDAIANVLLFAPFAAGLFWSGVSGRRIVAFGFALSVAIECLQLRLLPGRDATIADVVANTLGSSLGLVLAWWLPARRRSGAKTLATVAALLAFIVGVGVVLQPSFPDEVYYGQWTPDLGVFERYRGRVLSADIGGLPLPADRLADSRAVRERLREGAALHVHAVAGPRPTRMAPLFSIADGILLVGVEGNDLVLRVRTRAGEFRLMQPDLRWRGVMARIVPGDTIELEVLHTRRGYCVRLADRERCGLAFSVGQSWGLVHFIPRMPAAARTLLGCLSMLLLGVPVGLVFRRSALGYAALVLGAAGLIGLPALVGLATIPPSELAALAFGITLGAVAP